MFCAGGMLAGEDVVTGGEHAGGGVKMGEGKAGFRAILAAFGCILMHCGICARRGLDGGTDWVEMGMDDPPFCSTVGGVDLEGILTYCEPEMQGKNVGGLSVAGLA